MNRTVPALLLLATMFTAGCGGLRPEPPRKEYHVISAERRIRSLAPRIGEVLLLEPVRISPAFEDESFVYRRSATRYESDFYREFFAPPARLVEQSIAQWLRTAGSFGQVTDLSSRLTPDHSMTVNVVEIYGDYSGEKPFAVLTLQVALYQETPAGPVLMHSGTWHGREEVTEAPGSEDLVAAWNRALGQILMQLEREISEAAVTSSAPGGARPRVPAGLRRAAVPLPGS